ncbi:MAG: cobyric acid synthase [Desulfobulbaceae bacterium]|nr:cobyric acid synthase [Desulfobulbaceae bacterium]
MSISSTGTSCQASAPFSHGGNRQRLAAASGHALNSLIDFSASINPMGPPEYLRATLSRNLETLLHYPDPEMTELRRAAADHFAVDQSQVVAANGSTEIIHALPRALSVRRAVIPVPSYAGYQESMTAADCHMEFLLLAPDNSFSLDWHTLAQMLKGNEMVFLGQPSNPTGLCLDPQDIAAIARQFPQTLFVVDEAFIDFLPEPPTTVPLLQQFENLIILKSLTKFYAIPGLRLGLALTTAELAAKIRSQLPPWSVNSLALAVGTQVLADTNYAAASRELLTRLRTSLATNLTALGNIKVYKGCANYLLCHWQSLPKGFKTGTEVCEALLHKGIAIRNCANFQGLGADFFRVAVRTEQENAALLGALASLIKPGSSPCPRKPTPALMFQGLSSDAGKSILSTALCRILLQDGLRVAPFKSQNMSLNSFVTRDGGEMGRAQVVQAQACRLDPDTRMNPVLLKPVSHVGSQVILNGHAIGTMSVEEYVAYKPTAFAAAKAAYDSLAAEYDTIILEGAGSPAEVNLKSHDIVNMQMARYAQAPVLLVGDIDRGGVFASFVGTMEVMAEWERALVAGFVVNRFRGRETLLAPAFEYVKAFCDRPVLGVIPFLADLNLPEEDSVGFKNGLFKPKSTLADAVNIALIDLPHIANFTDFEPFLAEPDVCLRVVKRADQLGRPAAIILPGSKNVIDDLRYLIDSGLAAEIQQLASSGTTEIIGICGGFQMLGQSIADPHGIEACGSIDGLGLLPITTVLAPEKTLIRQSLTHLDSGLAVHGYEIHHGQTEEKRRDRSAPHEVLKPVLCGDGTTDVGLGSGLIWGTYLHGIFDADAFRHWFIDALRQRCGLGLYQGERAAYDLEPALDRLAATVRQRLDMTTIYRLLGL